MAGRHQVKSAKKSKVPGACPLGSVRIRCRTAATVRTRIIVNPTAGSGKAARSADILAQRTAADLQQTSRSGDTIRLARQACAEGVETLVIVGGDGTFSEAVEGVMTRPPESLCPSLALLPAGTGGDYRRSFELDESVDSALRRISKQRPRPVDIGFASYLDDQGRRSGRHFLNVCSVGLGGLTDQIVEKGPKWLGGRAAFFLGASKAALVHTPVPIELKIDDQLIEVAPFSNIAICLGRYFGGGMKIAPDALVDDGLFDIITIEGSALRNLSLAASIYQGSHLHRKGVRRYQGKTVSASSSRTPTPLIDLDGEQVGKLELKTELKPRALQILL